MKTRIGVAGAFAMAAVIAAADSPGSLDPAFNGTGVMLSSFDGWAGAVLVDDNHQIVVGGYTNDPLGRPGSVDRDVLVARYNANGTALNLGFSGETTILGTAVTDFSDTDVVRDMVLDAAGRIVVAGWMTVHFVKLVEAQTGKHIAASATLGGVTFEPAAELIGPAHSLMDAL